MAVKKVTPITEELPSIFYEEPERLEDGGLQSLVINHVGYLLMNHYRDEPDVLVNRGFIYYDRNDGYRRVAPDLYIAFDVDVEGIRKSKLPNYWTWEIGKLPDFVMEVASPSTADNDLGPKRALYERLGIREYWRLDNSPGSELYNQPLASDRLVGGKYRPNKLRTAADGTIWAYSSVLNLCIHWGPDLRDQFDIRTAEFRTINREVIEREARLAAEARESLEREARLAERAAAEARERELLAEIERLRRQLPEA